MQPLKDSQRPLEGPLREQLKGGPTEEQVLHTAGQLGLSEDLSSSLLLRKATEHGMPPVNGQVEAAYRQALADTATFKGVLQQVPPGSFAPALHPLSGADLSLIHISEPTRPY